jgi:SNF2-related domain/Helicase conserved C-terminal domain
MIQEQLFESLINGDKYEVTDWQEKDLRFLNPMPYSANWSQMGCYKTSTGLWLLERKRVKDVMIITSKVGKGAYFSDFYKCLPEEWELYNLGIHTVMQRIEDFEKPVKLEKLLSIRAKKRPRVFLCHYNMFTNAANNSSANRNGGMGIVDALKNFGLWDMILADEAHRLKNRDTQWTKNIKKLKAKNKHIMTGTGFVNNPAEIWSLLNFLDRGRWSSYWAFRNYFCDQVIDTRGFRTIRGLFPHRVEEFRKLRQSLGPRHTMQTVHKGISKPIESVHEVDLNPTQRRMYLDIKSTLQTLDQKGETLQSPNVLSQLNRLRQISVATPDVKQRAFDVKQNRIVFSIQLIEPSSKLDEVMDILSELDEPNQKVVIFSNFKDPIELLKTRFDKAAISYVHMEESHSEQKRYHLWHDVFPNTSTKVFLSTLDLGGESINLSCAQYLIFLDRSWSPAKMNQAIGRVYRPGQKNVLEVIYINAKKTVDGYVKKKLDTKEGWFNEIFSD